MSSAPPLKNSLNQTNNQAKSPIKPTKETQSMASLTETISDDKGRGMTRQPTENSQQTTSEPNQYLAQDSAPDSEASYDSEFDAEADIESVELDQHPVEAQQQDLEVHAEHTVTEAEAGLRIDKLAAEIFADHSRAQLQDWLKSGNLTVNTAIEKPKYRVKAGDKLLLQAKLEQHGTDQPEAIDLDIVYEDESVLVINKPVGMVVHPGAGNWTGTLVNGLLYHYPNQAHLPRAGLVHRIDKNTSGLLVIGKTKAAQLELQEQLKDKTVYRHYQCIVAGDVASLARQRVIDAPIGRHRTQRTKMTVTSVGKPAVTHIMDITELNENYCLLDVQLETGRTHQIRVHLSHIGHPIIGDDVYGNRQQLRAGLTEEQREAIQNFPRQALHAYRLGFVHPETGEDVEVTAPLPEDIVNLAEILSE